MARLFAGCMTGTSIDGLDAALVSVDGTTVDTIQAKVIRTLSRSLGNLKEPLRDLAAQVPMTAGQIAQLCRDFSLLHAQAIDDLRAGERIEAACVHGQTVFHRPPASWQLISPAIIAHTCGVPVVADLRAGDLVAGGQGAPLTPLTDYIFFRDRSGNQARMVLNLGGFANATLLGVAAGPMGYTGRDICACNQLLDLVARRTMGLSFDRDGQAALGAEPDADALDDLLGILRVQRSSGRSLGTGDEASAWIGRHWRGGAGVPGPALCATACDAIGQTIGEITRQHAGTDPSTAIQQIIVAGGGVRNAALMRAIQGWVSCKVEASGVCGIAPDAREAASWAVLGALALDGITLPLAHITGATRNVRAGVLAHP